MSKRVICLLTAETVEEIQHALYVRIDQCKTNRHNCQAANADKDAEYWHGKVAAAEKALTLFQGA